MWFERSTGTRVEDAFICGTGLVCPAGMEGELKTSHVSYACLRTIGRTADGQSEPAVLVK